jgi:aryl-alcohol dehydrogenase-like predicted oxidoreductase
MEHRALGRSGVDVSRIILGCGNFGGLGSSTAHFGAGETEGEAHALMDAAWEAGITTFDTADAYGVGRSESFIGWLRTKGGSARPNRPDHEDVQPDERRRRPRTRA